MVRILASGMLFAAAAHAGIVWERDLDKAQKRALKEDKLVFLLFYAEPCEPYEQMQADTFPRPDVQAWLGGLVCMRINGEGPAGDALATRFGIEGVPTIVLLEPSGRVLYNKGGRPEPGQFVDFFGMSAYNAAVDACNLENPKGAAPHLFFVRKWFGATNIGKLAEEVYRSAEKEEGFKAAYEAAQKAYDDGLAAARKAEEDRLEQARVAAQKEQGRRATATALKAEADTLYKKYLRTKAFDLYRRILAEYPDLPEAEEASAILRKNKQKLAK